MSIRLLFNGIELAKPGWYGPTILGMHVLFTNDTNVVQCTASDETLNSKIGQEHNGWILTGWERLPDTDDRGNRVRLDWKKKE